MDKTMPGKTNKRQLNILKTEKRIPLFPLNLLLFIPPSFGCGKITLIAASINAKSQKIKQKTSSLFGKNRI
jgi:hypothetical protein